MMPWLRPGYVRVQEGQVDTGMRPEREAKMSTPKTEQITGEQLLRDPKRNKDTAFTERERDALGVRGLFRPRVFSQEEQQYRILDNLLRKNTTL